jgi:hypothetical protein
MKLFTATVVSQNSCYVKILLIADQDMECARIALEEYLERKPCYKRKLEELPIQTCSCCKAQVLEVGFACNESNYEWAD